jgi:hypothetical protein
MTKGMVAKVGVLLGFTLLCIILAGMLVALIIGNMSFRGSIWQSFLHAIDPGTIAGDEGNLLYVFFMFLITIFGLLFTGTLIGILIIGIIANGLNLLGVAQGPQKMVKGAIIVVAVIIDVIRRKSSESAK